VNLADDGQAQQRLRHAAEVAKIALSSADDTQVRLPFLATKDATPVDLSTQLTRAEVELLCQDLIEQLAEITSEVLGAAKLQPRDVDEVLLVGGMTRMPAIRKRFELLFGKAPIVDLDASSAVAFGAALLGASAQKDYDTLGLKDILGSALSVQLPDGQLKPVFARHTPLPAERHLDVEGPAGALDLRVPVYQGSAGDPAKDNHLGVLELRGLKPGPTGKVRAMLTLSLSSDAILQMRAESGGVEQTLELQTLDAPELPIAIIEGEGAVEPLRRAGGE
jgi:molecular chaperone DnaK (HSP70)